MGPRLDEIKLEDVDFDRVAECRDKHVIKRYIQLIENDGSYFKELLQACKDKFLELAPKEYWLMYPRPTTDQEILDAKQDLLDWEMSVNEIDMSLMDSKKHEIFDVVSANVNVPIRGQEAAVARPNLQKPEKDRPKPLSEREGYARDKTKMKDYYSAWDKMDVDAMEAEMEEEERAELEAQRKHFEDLKEEQDSAHKVTPVSTKASKVPSAHRKHMADTEKEKGNEAFYAKDFEEAEAYYTRSLQFKADDPSTWANRALVRLKLQKAESALEDCEHSLALNPRYMKALHRKGKALHDLGRFEDAVKSFQLALAESPGNTQINGDLAVARRKLRTAEASSSAPPPVSASAPKIEELDPVTNLPLGTAAPKKAPPVRANYTRVQIEEGSDSESEEEAPIKTSSGAGQGFRKVVIEEVSGSEDEEEAAAAPSASSTASPTKSSENAGFRKVVITEDSDSEEEGGSGAGAKPDYVQAATYRGRKDGYIFTTRNGKTGYYLDSHGPRREAAAKPAAAHNFAPPSRVQAAAAPKAEPAKKVETPTKPSSPPAAKAKAAPAAPPPPVEEPPAVSFDDMD